MNGYKQAMYEIKIGLKPIYVWELKTFWVGYNFAIAKNRILCIIKNMNISKKK